MSYSVREADGLVRVCAILTGDTQREVLVNLTTLSGSALGQLSHTYVQDQVHSFLQSHGNRIEMHALYPTAADNDFTPAITPLVFGPSTSELCTNISVSQDSILETVEDFSVQLSTADPAVILSPRTASVTIVDMDGEYR